MPELDRMLVEHRQPIKTGFRPLQQPPKSMTYEVIPQVKAEIERLLKANFIKTAKYVKWLSNIVLVVKNNGKIRVCIDYRNLNLASPKDEYPMPVVDILIDSVAQNGMLSFMDGHARYNQIFLVKNDVHKTAFRCPSALGTYKWNVLSFGLKNEIGRAHV